MDELTPKAEIIPINKHDTLAEQTHAEMLRYLDNPDFEGVLEAAVHEGLLDTTAYEEFKALEDEERRARLRVLFTDINPRNLTKNGFIERNQLQASVSSPLFAEALARAADSVGMREVQPLPRGEHFKLAIVHGGAGKTPLLREQFLLNGLEESETSVEYAAMLGIDRPVDDAERGRAGDYANGATTESDLMDAAAIQWMKDKGLDDVIETREVHEAKKQGGFVSGMSYRVVIYDLSIAKVDGRLANNLPNALFIIEAPIDPTRLSREEGMSGLYKNRADTQDTLRFIAETADIEAGDTVLSISHQPVLTGQDLITKQAFLDLKAGVTSAGYHSEVLSNNPNLVLSELCKVVDGAGAIYDQTDPQREFQLTA
jgi:hypothetical protein